MRHRQHNEIRKVEGKAGEEAERAKIMVSVSVKAKQTSFDVCRLLLLLMRPARLERATFWFVAKSPVFQPVPTSSTLLTKLKNINGFVRLPF
jgi:hypothetical protein